MRDTYNDDLVAGKRYPKSLRKFRPTSEQSTYTSGDKVVFQLPKAVIWNGGQAYIRFQLQGTLGTAATYVCIQQGVHFIITEIRVRYGSQEIMYIRRFNAIKTIENLINRRYEIYEGNFLEGFDIINAIGTGNKRRIDTGPFEFVLPLYVDPLVKKDLHLDKQEERWEIEYVLAPANECLVTDAGVPSFTLSNPWMWYQQLEDGSHMHSIPKVIDLRFSNFHFTFMAYPANASSISFVVNTQVKCCKKLIIVLMPDATYTAYTDRKWDIGWSAQGVFKANLRIRGQIIPPDTLTIDPTSNSSELHIHNLRALNA